VYELFKRATRADELVRPDVASQFAQREVSDKKYAAAMHLIEGSLFSGRLLSAR